MMPTSRLKGDRYIQRHLEPCVMRARPPIGNVFSLQPGVLFTYFACTLGPIGRICETPKINSHLRHSVTNSTIQKMILNENTDFESLNNSSRGLQRINHSGFQISVCHRITWGTTEKQFLGAHLQFPVNRPGVGSRHVATSGPWTKFWDVLL